MGAEGGGVEALHRLKSTEAPLWLTPSPELSQTARSASQYLFSTLTPFCPKSFLDTLIIDGFDAEQIWQQIDLQTQPLISNLKRDVNRFEKNPNQISNLFGELTVKKKDEKKNEEEIEEFDDMEDDDEEIDDFDEDEDEDEDDEEEEEEEGGGVEDRFLKMNELEEYMEKDEAREYGGEKVKEKDPDDDDEEEEEDEDDEIGVFDDAGEGEEETEKLGLARYDDFFGVKKKKVSKEGSKPRDESEDEQLDNEDEDEDEELQNKTKEPLSTHEKEQQQLRSKIEEMEKANMEPKTWTMQGEVTAAKRPRNSALEVDLDFEHNVRPLPVITEEVTESLEDLIKKRIIEEHFDDVQKTSSLPSKAPREVKEMDENKSKKGLAEIYEEEYVQQTGGTGPVSSSDELKKEAQLLFDKLCLKLDALSHFHFKPKPVIEDMSIQTNVPALAMEEIAPVAVSDAAMLAPEEVFAGKGDIKEEAELTQAERKRRRANKKRKFKAEKSKKEAIKKAFIKPSMSGKEEQ